MLAKHLEGSALVDRMALHEYSLRALRDGAAPECAFEILVLGEAPEDDVDRALPGRCVGSVR